MYLTIEEFNEWRKKPSPVEWRRQEFTDKLATYLSAPDLSDMLVRDGKINYQFIIVGMTIEGQMLSGIGFDSFVANGYPPAGLSFAGRNLEGIPTAKFVFTKCFAIKKQGERYDLEPIMSDEEVLRFDFVNELFAKIVTEQYGGRLQYSTQLTKFKLRSYRTALLAWERPFVDSEQILHYLLADIDNACIYVISENEMENYRVIDDTRDRVCSNYSAYFFQEGHLIREEYPRTGGWGQFHG